MISMPLNKRRILCVDDNEDNSSMLTVLLGLSSYDAIAAGSVSEALQIARREVFDLFILDGRFPDGSGTALCREIREIHPHTPVIFYSGDLYLSDHAKESGADVKDYVAKPDIDGLMERVNQVLAS